MASEVRRVLAPGGVLMIQLYPFYLSEHGDHGWHRPSFEHLLTGVDETPDDAFLNRITLDELHWALFAADSTSARWSSSTTPSTSHRNCSTAA